PRSTLFPYTTLFRSIALPAGLLAQQKSDESQAKAKALVEKKLADLKGPGATVQVIEEKYVREVFPNHVFVAVRYPLWPVAVVPRSEEHTSELQSRGH